MGHRRDHWGYRLKLAFYGETKTCTISIQFLPKNGTRNEFLNIYATPPGREGVRPAGYVLQSYCSCLLRTSPSPSRGDFAARLSASLIALCQGSNATGVKILLQSQTGTLRQSPALQSLCTGSTMSIPCLRFMHCLHWTGCLNISGSP